MTTHISSRFTRVLLVAFLSCPTIAWSQEAKPWKATEIRAVEGFAVPECALSDPATGLVYVSNIDAAAEAYWADDQKGFISLLTSEGDMKALRWLDSSKAVPISSPKGMAILKELYFTDNTRLLSAPLTGSGPLKPISLQGTQKLNDLATDGQNVWSTDMAAATLYKVDAKGKVSSLPAVAGVNGVTCHKGKLFVVSWDLHEVYEIDPLGKKPAQAFGLASHFTNLDGIEVLDDGTFLVSDFTGNKVCTISPDRKSVQTLASLESPADIGVDRTRDLLYVPQFMKNRLVIFKLSQ